MTRAFNKKLVFRTLGALLLIEAMFMCIATLVSFLYEEPDTEAFAISNLLTMLAGFAGLRLGHRAPKRTGEREGYLIVALVWLVFSLFGMLPFYLSGAVDSLTDAFFETMAGFTTTGATVIRDVESMTHGILIWRAITQWLGGLGIIVLCVAILPMFGLGGMQLYAAEVTGVSYEKISPRIADTAKLMWAVYVLLTAAEIGLLWLCGMEPFDSVCHSMSTIATGGFSTKNMSLMDYSPAIQYVVAVFMLLSGINFSLLILTLLRKPQRLIHDEETHWYLAVVGIFTVLISAGLFIFGSRWSLAAFEESFRHGFFMVTAAVTSTGYAVTDYMEWRVVLWVMLFFLMFTGASSGSTSGGIKWVRLAIIFKNSHAEFMRRIHPNAIIPVKLNGKPVPSQTINNVVAFMIIYVMVIIVTVIAFCACGLGFDEAIGTTVSAIGNVGISIGSYGPTGTYADFPTTAKWIMTLVMLIGRLEIFTVLLLFTPALWKK
ncbi:MAG: TrkH family potassium uptake protein [Paludibacteraceae bacterium]|nr:TrkH family potassium uptake protein [Paludibacteraceae bacterium]